MCNKPATPSSTWKDLIMQLQTLKEKLLPQLFIIYTRYIIGSAFVFSSIVKIKGERFTSNSGEENPINSSWHFFETLYQSGIYWKFLGLAQLIAGFLLITQRFSRLGAIVFFPIIANVFVITISYDFHGTPIITGLMLLATVLLLLWDKDQLQVLWNEQAIVEDKTTLSYEKGWQWTGLALFFLSSTSYKGIFVVGPIIWVGTAITIVIGGGIYTLMRYKKPKNI